MSNASTLYPRRYYPYLDGFRAVSILWVILHHVQVFFDLRFMSSPEWLPLMLTAKIGQRGVDMFFVISGFLITGLLIGDLDGKVRVKRFYLRRIFKIIPSYLTIVMAGLLLAFLIRDQTFTHFGNFFVRGDNIRYHLQTIPQPVSPEIIGRYFCFLQNYHEHLITLAHTWSIAIEEHFYLAYPLIFAGIARMAGGFGARRRRLVLILIGLILLTIGYRYVCVTQFLSLNSESTFVRIDALMLGCLLRLAEPSVQRLPDRLTRWLAPLCLLAGLLIYGWLCGLALHLASLETVTAGQVLWRYVAIYAAPALLILAGMLNFRPLVALMSQPALIAVGKHSYGTYLWHYLLIFPFALLQDRLPVIPLVGLYVTASLLAGYLSTILIERPFLDMRRKYCP
ncbi:MAG: acyltransferase [Candidatus Omnitrophica bacterium]|nr:acyltransferase [Candidatus Omnitrophota bacterium]MCB9722297.1 acyltransferase [Candidatus Omnitrophota bacterium]